MIIGSIQWCILPIFYDFVQNLFIFVFLNTDSLKRKMIVKTNVDLNNLTEFGFYSINHGSNAPNGTSGWVNLVVLPYSNNLSFVFQMATAIDYAFIYVRRKFENAWSDWKVTTLT